MKTIEWYFDFISPFAYLQHIQLQKVLNNRQDIQLHYRPILFAGLLKANGHKGPAEIPAKRIFTYRYCHWYARQHNIPFNMPAAHPFNPLTLLRLAIAESNASAVISQLFEHVWVHSQDDPHFFEATSIEHQCGFRNIAERTADSTVKETLKDNTTNAIELGVFGVPTLLVNNELFWGADTTAMAIAFLDNPALLDNDAYQHIDNLPVAQARK